MSRRLSLVVVLVAGALVLPSASSAQTPAQDSVQGAGVAGGFTYFALDATSGPSGENPSGHVSFQVSSFLVSGPVTCLAVRGDTATLNIEDSILGPVTVQVADGPDSFDAYPTGRAPTDCSALPPTDVGGPLSDGDITIVDAPPLPTSNDQCKNGGWRNYTGFKNEGQCIAFVKRGQKP